MKKKFLNWLEKFLSFHSESENVTDRNKHGGTPSRKQYSKREYISVRRKSIKFTGGLKPKIFLNDMSDHVKCCELIIITLVNKTGVQVGVL